MIIQMVVTFEDKVDQIVDWPKHRRSVVVREA